MGYKYELHCPRCESRASGIVVKFKDKSVLVNLTQGDKRGRHQLSYSGYTITVAMMTAAGEKTRSIRATCTSEIRQRSAEAMSAMVDEIKLSSIQQGGGIFFNGS